MRKFLTACLFSVTTLFLNPLFADSMDGRYVTLPNAIPTSSGEKVEVLVFFGFGCPFCYQLEPSLNEWQKTLPEGVEVTTIPAPFGGAWDNHAAMFYALEAMGAAEQLRETIFHTIQVKKRPLDNLSQISKFVAEQGIDADEFKKIYSSFAVKSKVQKAKMTVINYKVDGVPSLAVNGKYSFNIASAGGTSQVAEVADYLVKQELQAAEKK